MRIYLKPIILFLATFFLFGCASIFYEPVKLDSSPLAIKISENCTFSEQKLSESKAKDCAVPVQASLWASRSGIKVKSGKKYCIQVPPNQMWFDATRRNTPPFGEAGNWVMKYLGSKRHPEYEYFSLIANTRNEIDGTLSKGHAVERRTLKNGSFEGGPLYIPDGDGELVFYPNDAVGSVGNPAYYYENNSGQIWVNVRQCEENCDCPIAMRSF